MIGKDIVVSIIDIRSDGVRIGIDAPREVRVTRAEIFEAIERQNAEAAAADESAAAALLALAPPAAAEPAAEPTAESEPPQVP